MNLSDPKDCLYCQNNQTFIIRKTKNQDFKNEKSKKRQTIC